MEHLNSIPEQRLLNILKSLQDDMIELRQRPPRLSALSAAPEAGSDANFWGFADGRVFFRTPDGKTYEFRSAASTAAGVAPSPSTVAPPVQVATQEYRLALPAKWVASYVQGGSALRTDSLHGYYGYEDSSTGLQVTMIGFDDVTATLAGSRVTAVNLFINNLHAWSEAGGTIRFGAHNQTAAPATFSESAGGLASAFYQRNDGHYSGMPNFAAGLKSGAYRGFTLNPADSSLSKFGYIAGVGESGSPVLEIKYVK